MNVHQQRCKVVFLENNNISIESSSDLFNLGVIAISLSEYSAAKYYFSKSLVGNLFSVDAYQKLSFVNQFLEKSNEVIDPMFFKFLFLLKN